MAIIINIRIMNHLLRNIIIIVAILTYSGSSWAAPKNEVLTIQPDKERLLRNPLNGWVVYAGSHAPADFWSNYDNINVPALGRLVRVSDYAHTLYIRSSWTDLNPEDGVYGWDANTNLKNLIQGALDRKMRLSFRVVIDSRDKPYSFSPEFVRKAGAKGFVTKKLWSPYPDDPVFQKYFEKFVEAFAERFNDPSIVDFMDGFSLGKWGEYHTLIYSTGDNTPRKAVFEWMTDLYAKHFNKVPVVINYHRWIGTEKDWTNDSQYDSDSEELLRSAMDKGYSLRHDAFGMTTYYGSWERDFANKYRFTRPIIMEGGWIIRSHSYWNDPRHYRANHPEDVRRGEFDDAKEAHVNMMDFRYKETESWFESAYDLVQRFISEGGYRLYPDRITLPKEIKKDMKVEISHRWNNLGWGYCPTNIPQWNQKYKVAFALLSKEGQVKHIFVDTNTDLSKWIKGNPTEYNFATTLNGISKGEYTWAVGIVDTTLKNRIGLEIAAIGEIIPEGWLKLSKVKIK